MTQDPHLTVVPTDPQGVLLHGALQKVLAQPALPEGFRASVLATVLSDRLQEVEARRKLLELEHVRALQQLRAGHVLLQRDTLALIVAGAFAAGACANLAVPWLREAYGLDSAFTMPALALLIGAAAGASVWISRFGKPGVLLRMGQD